jgi:hypothetical protein
MKNWETAEFTDKFCGAMMCSNCPARTACAQDDSNDCIHTFFAYAMQECATVKKMTMQKWADVTGMPVTKDMDGKVYLYSDAELEKHDNNWHNANATTGCINITNRVTDAEKHDWNIPCYPEEIKE